MSLMVLLDEATRFDAEHGDGSSSQLTTALGALRRLGVGDARLSEFAAGYAQRLRAAPPPQAWPAGDPWAGRLGERAAWPAYRDLFGQWLAHEGIGDLLNQVLPVLMPGCGGAAFHGLIQTACAVQAVHPASLADGLAYWASTYRSFGPMAGLQGETDPIRLLRQLPAGRSKARLMADRMRDAARGSGVPGVIGSLQIDERTPERLSRAAAFAYAQSGSSTALHLVTSGHALRTLMPFIDDAPEAWRCYWQAFALGVVAAALQPLPIVPSMPWAEIIASALASDDAHLIQLVDSCREEEATYGGREWQAAASRGVQQLRKKGTP